MLSGGNSVKKSDCEAERFYGMLTLQNIFWNRLKFLNKHRILSRGLKNAFYWNFVKIFDWPAFSLFETVPGCRAYSHSVLIIYKKRKLKSNWMTPRAGLKINILKISENVRNPTENVPKSSVNLRQPSRCSVIFARLRVNFGYFRMTFRCI